MIKKLLLSLCIILYNSTIINCMFKSTEILAKHFIGINQTLQAAGLFSELCKIIGYYDGYRIYHQLDNAN